MSTAIAMAPSPAPHDRQSYNSELTANTKSAAGTSRTSPASQRLGAASSDSTAAAAAAPTTAQTLSSKSHAPAHSHSQPRQRSDSGSPKGAHAPRANPSPPSASRNALPNAPRIMVKKEPTSPEPPPASAPAPPPATTNETVRHRPRRLDLSQNTISTAGNTPATGRGPLTGRESGLGISDLANHCLSPGFIPKDQGQRQVLDKSQQMREQQRHLIESKQRQAQLGNRADGPDNGFAARTPGMSRRGKAPPGLSIVAPNAEHFAHERVVQSAPLHQSFTGLSQMGPPQSRHTQLGSSRLSNTSHMHITHQPANQTNNRLPPISDVFNLPGHSENNGHSPYPSQNHRGPLVSPGHPPLPAQAQMQNGASESRPREYRSAEEAQAEMARGRPDMLPNLVHYNPPSPGASGATRQYANVGASGSSSKRSRADYEEGGSPPLGNGRASHRRGPYGEGRDSPETTRAKKEKFLELVGQAWDLWHS